jgi:two-component system nitrate/nitrite response regulator NarL
MTEPSRPVRLVIADDHPIFREGLRRLLQSEPGYEIIGEAADALTAVTLVRTHQPDVLLLDLVMPNGGGLTTLRELAISPPPTRVIVLTAAIERSEIVTAVQLGVRGIITKESTTALLFKCMQRVLAGEYWLGREAVADLVQALMTSGQHETPPPGPPPLTPRELEIIAAVVDGASNREVADQFGLSPQTVKNHLSSIFDKLGVSNRLELAMYATTHRLLPRAGRSRPPRDAK